MEGIQTQTYSSVEPGLQSNSMLDTLTSSETSVSWDEQENFTMQPAFNTTPPAFKTPEQNKQAVLISTGKQKSKQNDIAFGRKIFKSTK